MKYMFLLVAIIVVFSASGFSLRGQAYYKCDAPLQEYSCYNTDETPYCPETGLQYVRGWCSGGNNIQCCAPPEMPKGTQGGIGKGITDYGVCDSPLENYRCYDINEIAVCPQKGLNFVRGWCPGPNNIRCCARPETPEGKRIGGAGISEDTPQSGQRNLRAQNFAIFLQGDYEIC